MTGRPTTTTTSRDGTRIAYESLGDGPPLVLVQGALGFRAISFAQAMAEGLGRGFTVHAYDRRGRGDSGDTPPYSVQKEVEDLAAVCQAAGGKPFVVGLSSGAALALEAAASGVPMAGLYAYEPPYTRAHPGERIDGEVFRTTLDRLAAEGRRDEAVSYFMRTVGVPAFVVPIMRLMPFWKHLRAAAHTLPYDARVLGSFEVPAGRLAKVRTPTVVGAGGKTTTALKAAAQAVAAAVPGARLDVVPKSNHGVKAGALLPRLEAVFLDGSPAAAPRASPPFPPPAKA